MTGRTVAFLILLSAASPALAQAGTSIPEPSDALLFGMGLAGLIIGRIGARRKPDE